MTPTNTETVAAPNPSLIKVNRPAQRVHVPRLFSWLFGGFAGLALMGLTLPVTNSTCMKGVQTKALMQAKQVGLALKLFAADHDGAYPCCGVPQEMTATPTDSNTAFACLFPAYTTSETLFANKLSAYQTAVPDNVIDSPYTGVPKETLQPGENVYAYVMGLTDADDPHTPLVADGTDGTGFYNGTQSAWGGVWKGIRAVVIHLDNSGALEPLAGPSDARFVASPAPAIPGHAPGTNLLDFARSGRDFRLLDPAIGPRRR